MGDVAIQWVTTLLPFPRQNVWEQLIMDEGVWSRSYPGREAVWMSGREGWLAHKGRIYQQRWFFLTLQEMGGEQGFCTVEYLGGKGIAALLSGVQWAKELDHWDPFLPLWRLDWLAGSWVTLASAAAAACVKAKNTFNRKAWVCFLLEPNRFPLICFSISASNLPPTCNSDVLGYGYYSLIKAVWRITDSWRITFSNSLMFITSWALIPRHNPLVSMQLCEQPDASPAALTLQTCR